MSTQQDANKELVRTLYGRLMGHGDGDAGRAILAERYVDHDVPGPFPGTRDGLIEAVMGVRRAFPDIQPELFEMVAEDDSVAVRVEAAGTHSGEAFMGIPATGKLMRWKEIHMFRCEGGEIVEHWGVFDLLSILQQLGAFPASESV